MMVELKVLDLFSGIGGFSLGLEKTGGFETVAFCENDPYAQRVLRRHWPHVPVYDDVRRLGINNLIADGVPAPDLICGGFPCQDISAAGRGGGLTGSRSGLWFEALRIIGECSAKAPWIIIENVPVLRSRGLDTVLGGLTEIGYDAEWHCVPAGAIGAPHRRDRIWIIAYPQHTYTDRERSHRTATDTPGQSGSIQPEYKQICLTGSVCKSVAYPNGAGRSWPGSAQSEEWISDIVPVGAGATVADTDLLPGIEWRPGHAGEGAGGRGIDRSIERANRFRDAYSTRLAQRAGIAGDTRAERTSTVGADRRPPEPDMGGTADGLPAGLDGRGRLNIHLRPDDAWMEGWEDGIPRIATGVKDRISRLRCLGNSVVPHIPMLIGEAILKAMAERG